MIAHFESTIFLSIITNKIVDNENNIDNPGICTYRSFINSVTLKEIKSTLML